MTLLTHELPDWAGAANFNVKAASDDAYRELVRAFVSFYYDHLFNDHWGEQVHFKPDNTLEISMVSVGIHTIEAQNVWQAFINFVARSLQKYTLSSEQFIGSIPMRGWWDVESRKQHHHPVFKSDSRPGSSPNNVWWTGDSGQVSWYIWSLESQWMPASLLNGGSQQRLAEALFQGSRHSQIQPHFNKGLAGAPPVGFEKVTRYRHKSRDARRLCAGRNRERPTACLSQNTGP